MIPKETLTKELFSDILGHEQLKHDIKSALLLGHHILIVGPPGVGKTTIAKNIAKVLGPIELHDCPFHCDPKAPCPGCEITKTKKMSGEERFVRIQGSPDLTVEDLIGDIDPVKALQLGPLSMKAFTPGKIFKANNGVLFFDELNRCPEKLQNALLQVLSEGIATLGSYDVDIPAQFIFIATMNPDDSSTEKLSDVLLDRFDVFQMGYPETLEIERDILKAKGQRLVEFPERLLDGALEFIRMLRASEELAKKPSVRASLSLYERSQANAVLLGRDEVTSDDINRAIPSVLSHRITLKPSLRYTKDPIDFLKEELHQFRDRKRKKGDGL
ncbi:AAA family ATPase [Candidatus Woesearchaeota archaeon]|nr:AAA family ATPase [Candidatus Woesearchaeota archaeon]HIH38703.1 AAA domain-containing protein [Candidatus Woesearchaeota archaeon]HIH49756.1 AAA domain-containing protein [Candidatus Woesearchaeota archaeon]HIJ03593.1 AAA domain-containing protein [Candidatus Woesearchaeota archaeon]